MKAIIESLISAIIFRINQIDLEIKRGSFPFVLSIYPARTRFPGKLSSLMLSGATRILVSQTPKSPINLLPGERICLRI